jgi:hypothetical protein
MIAKNGAEPNTVVGRAVLLRPYSEALRSTLGEESGCSYSCTLCLSGGLSANCWHKQNNKLRGP